MHTKQVRFFILGILILLGFIGTSTTVFAVTNNISGYVWGADTATLSFQNGGNFLPSSGWIWGNNASNTGGIGFISLGDGATYGLYTDDFGAISGITGVPGNEGYAWSSNYGWINVNAGCPSNSQGAKIGSNVYTGCNAQFVNPTTTVESGSLNDKTALVGWARACSVFKTGCDGGTKDDLELGGWDGWISLSKYNDHNFTNGTIDVSTASNYGVNWNPATTALSGYAWGGEVVGWINFAGATMEAPNEPIVLTLTSPNTCSVAGGQISLTWGITGTGASTYHCTGTSTGVPQKWLESFGIPSQTKTVTVGAVPDTFTIACTSSNPALPDISASFTTSNNVCSGPVLKIEQNPAWTKTLPTGEQCVNPNDVYSPQVTIDMTSLGDTNAILATTRCDVNWGKDIGINATGACLNRNASGNPYVVFANNGSHPALWLNDVNRTWRRCANQGGKCDLSNTPGAGSRNYIYGISGTNNYVMQTLNQPTCDGLTFGTTDIPGAQCFFDPNNSATPEVNIIQLNGTDRTPGPNFGTPFSEAYPPTNTTIPSIMDVLTYPNDQAFGAGAVNGANGEGWNTVDFLYPRESYFDVNRCTLYSSGYANEIWTILHPSDPINNAVPFKEGTDFVFKLNDNLSSFYSATAHNDPSIGPHEQCLVHPQGKSSYTCHYNGTVTCTAVPLDPVYAKPQPPYDEVRLSYCEMDTTLTVTPASCQVYNTAFTARWSVPSANAETCTATTSCTDAGGQPITCSGWSGAKSATVGPNAQQVTITATGGTQELYATLSITCDNTESGKSSTTTAPPVHIQPNAQACITAAVCGNAIPEAGEQCDAGASNGLACIPGATGCTYCGGGVNACKIVTVAPAVCGDGVVDATETCDDGNMEDGDACYSKGTLNQCTFTKCGDGNIQNKPTNSDGIIEACDEGAGNGSSTCDISCQVPIPLIVDSVALSVSSCVVSGSGILPVATWSSRFASTCDEGVNSFGFTTSNDTSGTDDLLDTIPAGTHTISITCENTWGESLPVSDSFLVVAAGGSCNPGPGGGGTSAPIRPVYIDS